MKLIMDSLNLICFLFISLLSSRALLFHCEGRSLNQPEKLMNMEDVRDSKIPEMKTVRHLDVYYSSSDPYYYMGSPLNLPPYDDSALAPSSPQENPPFCIYPPFTPNLPSTTPPAPTYLPYPPPPPPPPPPPVDTNPGSPEFPGLNPPDYVPGPPEFGPSPPSTTVPNPPIFGPNPPDVNFPFPPMFGPGPPEYGPSPPSIGPSPPVYVPEPPSIYVPEPPSIVPNPPVYVPVTPIFVPVAPIFLPPIIYPAPSVPPPPAVGWGSRRGLWCVAKPTVPDPIIQEAMNYACGSGADCEAVQPTGSCYQPDTVLDHASYAFNSYFQRTKVAGAVCDFGGTAILVTKDPSHDGCRFIMV